MAGQCHRRLSGTSPLVTWAHFGQLQSVIQLHGLECIMHRYTRIIHSRPCWTCTYYQKMNQRIMALSVSFCAEIYAFLTNLWVLWDVNFEPLWTFEHHSYEDMEIRLHSVRVSIYAYSDILTHNSCGTGHARKLNKRTSGCSSLWNGSSRRPTQQVYSHILQDAQ